MAQIALFAGINGIIFSILLLIRSAFDIRENNEAKGYLKMVVVANIILNIAQIIADQLEGSDLVFGRDLIYIGYMLVFASEYLMILGIARHIYYLLKQNGAKQEMFWLRAVEAFLAIDFAGLLMNIPFHVYFYVDERNDYHRSPYLWVEIVFTMIAVFILLQHVIRYSTSLPKLFQVILPYYFLPPSIGIMIDLTLEQGTWLNMGMTVSIFMIYLVYERVVDEDRKDQERRLLQSRAYLLNSQIRPHFMFNALSVIQSLIYEDQDSAVEAINHLAAYLRKELNLKTVEHMIPIMEELDYVKHYLYIEQLRFGDKLKVTYDIEEDDPDFYIPFLTIQPLVENSVRHGIRKKLEGGTVRIRICSDDKSYIVEVIDDGVGMKLEGDHPAAKKKTDSESEKGNGIGLKNVEERLRMLCDGTLSFYSKEGEGTRAVIRIPKKNK